MGMADGAEMVAGRMSVPARILRGCFALVVTSALACSTSDTPVAEGAWGGPNASLALSRSGGTLGYSCGSGTMDSTWTVSADGRLTATGQHFFGGGPLPSGGRPPHPATYEVHLDGRVMTLTVVVTDQALTLGPFTMVRGGKPVQEICL